jgi:hypothetical protein
MIRSDITLFTFIPFIYYTLEAAEGAMAKSGESKYIENNRHNIQNNIEQSKNKNKNKKQKNNIDSYKD